MTYITKVQRVEITNFLKWLMVEFDLDLNESIFEGYTSGIGATMHNGINHEILDSIPIEIKIDIVNRLFLAFGRIHDLSFLIKFSQFLEKYNMGGWTESVMLHSIVVISQNFFFDSVRIVPMALNKAVYKLSIYLDNFQFEMLTWASSFAPKKCIKIVLEDSILHKTMEYTKQPHQSDVEELLGNLLTMQYIPIELERCNYINSSYRDMNYLEIVLTDMLYKK